MQVVQWRETDTRYRKKIQFRAKEKEADDDEDPSLCARSCLMKTEVNQGIRVERMQIKQAAQRTFTNDKDQMHSQN